MLMAASPGRAAAMVPAPVERSELPGHRQRSQIPQHRQWWRSRSLAQRCGAAARKDQRNLAALTRSAALTRAREAAPIPARSEADRPAPAGSAALRLLADVDISFSRNCCWQLRGRTLELGRSAPMLMAASPGRAAAMVPAPVERSELPGHRQRSQIPQHRQWWRSRSLAQRCGAAARKDQRNLAALTRSAALTRAREAAPIPARSEADRPAPAGSAALRLLADVDISFSRNCCWQLRGRTLELGRSAPMLMAASPGRAAAMVPAPVERSELPGHRQRSQIPQHRQWWRSRSLAQRCGAAARKDQRNLAALTRSAALTRAREAAPIPARSEADRPAPAGSAALRLLADVDISFSRNCCWQLRGRTLELGRSAPMLMAASPGRAAAMVPAPVERSELPGHRQRSQIPQHRQW